VLIHPHPDTWETLEKQPDASIQNFIVLVTMLGILWMWTGLQALVGQPPPHISPLGLPKPAVALLQSSIAQMAPGGHPWQRLELST
jgi:hypothetical protein